MKKLKRKGSMLLYGCAGMGVNMLNLMMGSYLCSAIIASGFGESAIANQTFLGIDLVVAAVWSIFGLIAKIVDGLIDIPMASFTDRLKTKWGRRRPALLIGLIPMTLAYLAFLVVPEAKEFSLLNTIYYGLILCIFYSFYTLTMVTYYATFTEIVETDQERNFISNVKSVCDIVYFILGYVIIPIMLKGLNIRLVSLIVLPLVLTMLIPMFMIKEESTLNSDTSKLKTVNLFKSLAYTFKNKDFIIWMIVYSFMTFGVQLFLGGINEYFSVSGMSMMFVMASSFAPVPFTLILYNYIIKKKGFRLAFQFTLLVYSVSMIAMFFIGKMEGGASKTILSILGGIVSSFGIGALFSVAYSIPSQLAADDEAKTGISHSAMYFAVQGLFSGVATGIASMVVLTLLKVNDVVIYMTLICAIGTLLAFAFTFILPKSIVYMGMDKPDLNINNTEEE